MATVCVITRPEFMRDGAVALPVQVNGATLQAGIRQFSTGSLGWCHSGKVDVKVGDKIVRCQVGLNITVIGSKELPA